MDWWIIALIVAAVVIVPLVVSVEVNDRRVNLIYGLIVFLVIVLNPFEWGKWTLRQTRKQPPEGE